MSNLTLKIVVVPSFINVDIQPIFLEEGGTHIITKEDLKIGPDFYADKIHEYLVEQHPIHGVLELTTRRGIQLTKFTPEELKEGLVQVSHMIICACVVDS